ncbi:MAG TPA: pyridoxamine 5'-phosphate oxidase family protein [bacterium]|nr:pyridoxamine 5'-phosphate oxidase family protein [bacterium]
MDRGDLMGRIGDVLASRHVGVLATSGGDGPHATLVAFKASENCRRIVFSTPRQTRKYANIKADPRAALLVDDRSNAARDIHDATGVTAVGTVAELSGSERSGAEKSYMERHPHLAEFVLSGSTALMELSVRRYVVVSRFQEVFELEME